MGTWGDMQGMWALWRTWGHTGECGRRMAAWQTYGLTARFPCSALRSAPSRMEAEGGGGARSRGLPWVRPQTLPGLRLQTQSARAPRFSQPVRKGIGRFLQLLEFI